MAPPGPLIILGLAFGLVGCAAPPCASGVCLAVEEARQTRWGFAPESLHWGDVDGDGFADLVAASHARGTVSVVWGATWTLGGTATTWSVAGSVAGIAVADVDGDGRVDLITAAPDDDAVAVLRGRGRREFDSARMTTVGEQPRGVIAVDLDGEAGSELVTIDAGDGFVSVVRGDVVTRAVVGSGPRGLAAGDFNDDGRLDVVVALADRAGLQVMLGDGDGGLAPGEFLAVGAAPYAVVVEDFDEDGLVDLASADALMNSVSVLFGDGRGGVGSRRTWAVDPDPRGLVVLPRANGPALAVLSRETGGVQVVDPQGGVVAEGTPTISATALVAGDIDGDGRVDPVVTGADGVGGLVPGVGVRLAETWAVNPEVEAEPGFMMFAVDVDGDGVDELLRPLEPATDTSVGSWGLWRDGALVAELVGDVETARWAVAGDFDGDGLRDVIVAGQAGGMVFNKQEEGEVFSGEPWIPPLALMRAIVAVDVDGDGRDEVVTATPIEDVSRIDVNVVGEVSMPGEAMVEVPGVVDRMVAVDGGLIASAGDRLVVIEGFEAVRELVVLSRISAFAVADVDGDGLLDGVLCSGQELAVVTDLLGEMGEPERLGEVGCAEVVTGDVDGDGAHDVLALRESGRRRVLTPWLRKEEMWSAWGSAALPATEVAGFGQLDADGVPDVWVGGAMQPARGLRTELGEMLVDLPVRRFGGAGPQFADLDGDGVLDMFAYSFGVMVAYGDGDGGFGVQTNFSREEALAGGSINSAALADFDGDGAEDVFVVVRPDAGWGTELRRLTIGGEVSSETIIDKWAQTDVRLAAGEVDGDGEVDLIAFSPWLGLVLLRGTGDGSFAEAERVADCPENLYQGLIADMDGDGRRDFLTVTFAGLMLHRGLGGGALAPAEPWWPMAYGGLRSLALVDVNHDGRQDLAAVDYTGRAVFVFGAGTRVAGAPRVVGSDVDALALADLDGDGTVELLTAGQGSHQQDGEVTLGVGRGTGDGVFSVTEQVIAAARPTGITVADFDGDGVLEVALSGGGEVTIVRRAP